MRIKEEPKIQAVVRECYEIAAALKKADPAYYEIFAWLNQEFRRRLKSRTLLVEILRAAKNNHARGQRPVDMWKYFSGIAMPSLPKPSSSKISS
jgi:hypothetical protein